jgi:hypothetical protein
MPVRQNTMNLGSSALFSVPEPPRFGWFLRGEFAFLLVVGVVFWGGYLVHEGDLLRVGYKMDFLGIYVGSQIVASGAGSQLYDLPTQAAFSAAAVEPLKRGIMPFVYPAYVAVILKPLGLLDFRSAIKVWFLVNLAAVFWSGIRLARFFGCGVVGQFVVLVIFLSWPPLQVTLIQGQMGLLPTVGFIESLIALAAGREWRAGFCLSLGLMKPQMILLPVLWFLLRGSWRVLASFSAVAAGVLGVSIASVGFWIPKYLHFLGEYNRRGAELALYPIAMQNWRGLACWLFGTDSGWSSRIVVLLLTGLSVLALVFLSYRGGKERSRPLFAWEVQFAIAIVLGLLSSPHLYVHDWVAALPAGFALWAFARESPREGAHDSGSHALLWLIGLTPMVFFCQLAAQTTNRLRWAGPVIPIYGLVLVTVALRVWSKRKLEQAHIPTEGQ